MKKLALILMLGMACYATAWADGKNTKVALNNDKSEWIDATAVTVADYKEYVNFLQAKSGDAYAQMAMPNATICKSVYGKVNYMNDASCQTMAIVGLTMDQMKAYCAWRTDRENAQNKKNAASFVVCSLPTVSQMQAAYDKGVAGVGNGVNEITIDGKVVVGAGTYGLKTENAPAEAGKYGFRCVTAKMNR